jgi:hypothetical protein
MPVFGIQQAILSRHSEPQAKNLSSFRPMEQLHLKREALKGYSGGPIVTTK